ncbi:MAG: nicotinate-nucleotide--dimethylbenzimidazole phosphoribosyltransferase, partial [Pseudomonadota bacterium]
MHEIEDAFANLPSANESWREAARVRDAALTKPAGALGRLEELAVFLAGWGDAPAPRADLAKAVVFAGNHGVTAHGVTPFPPAVTGQMVANFRAGGAAINALCAANDIALDVVALDLETPTGDITCAPALNQDAFLAAFNAGVAAVRGGGSETPPETPADIYIFGEMGIGNTTIAAALGAHCLADPPAAWVGPGTGSAGPVLARKVAAVEAACAHHADVPRSGLAPLLALGGRELAGIAGGVLAARLARRPVI